MLHQEPKFSIIATGWVWGGCCNSGSGQCACKVLRCIRFRRAGDCTHRPGVRPRAGPGVTAGVINESGACQGSLLALELARGHCWHWSLQGVTAGTGAWHGSLLKHGHDRGHCWHWGLPGVTAGTGACQGSLLELGLVRGHCWNWGLTGVIAGTEASQGSLLELVFARSHCWRCGFPWVTAETVAWKGSLVRVGLARGPARHMHGVDTAQARHIQGVWHSTILIHDIWFTPNTHTESW